MDSTLDIGIEKSTSYFEIFDSGIEDERTSFQDASHKQSHLEPESGMNELDVEDSTNWQRKVDNELRIGGYSSYLCTV
jgi:hypothetical protein